MTKLRNLSHQIQVSSTNLMDELYNAINRVVVSLFYATRGC